METARRSQFEEATLSHLDSAYNLARWLTRDEHAAEDVVQDSYFRAARYFAGFRGGDGRAWLLGIVRRAAYDWLAKWRGQRAVGWSDEIDDVADRSPSPAGEAISKCEQASVRAAIEELPPPLREAIVLREIEGLSYQEIAAVADIPLGTVMSRISRGRKQLQRRLAGCADGK